MVHIDLQLTRILKLEIWFYMETGKVMEIEVIVVCEKSWFSSLYIHLCFYSTSCFQLCVHVDCLLSARITQHMYSLLSTL